ncbi:hypothetical protein [Streptomyces sp. RG80]|uniref:hypothetical protein n=1 Tax=Streptomyces sp. RG80 TaxID=3157340 RepID=UPI00338F0E68
MWTHAALAAHQPGQGRIVVHPTPSASHPPGLAQDVLAALGKTLPGQKAGVPRHRAGWADMVRPAWTAAACWIHAHRIGHLIVIRAHTQTPMRWAQLAQLQRRTGIHLTLLWHDAPARLGNRAQAWQERPWVVVGDEERARRRLRHNGRRPVALTHRQGSRTSKTAWRGTEAEDEDRAAVIRQLAQVGHPLHAGLLTAQIVSDPVQAEQLAHVRLTDLAPDATAFALPDPARPGSLARTWHPVPEWARPALVAARAWHYLTGHPYSSRRIFQHSNFHHHNQLIDIARELGINAAIDRLDGDPAWPRNRVRAGHSDGAGHRDV